MAKWKTTQLKLANGDGGSVVIVASEDISTSEILIHDGEILMRNGSAFYLRAPSSAISRLTITEAAEEVLQIINQNVALPGIISYTSAAGDVSAKLLLNEATYDLSSDSGKSLQGIDVIDLSQLDVELKFTPEDIVRLNGGHGVHIIAQTGDRLISTSGWALHNVEIVGGGYVQTLSNQSALLRISQVREWHNPLNGYDVNGDGKVSTLDALSVINAINGAGVATVDGSFLPAAQISAAAFQSTMWTAMAS